MRIFFDHGTPFPLSRHFTGHEVRTALERGWHRLENGELILAAEREGYDVIITTDHHWRHQQNLSARRIAILVLMTTDWRAIRPHAQSVVEAVLPLGPGEYREWFVPR